MEQTGGYDFYIASPFFNEEELENVKYVEQLLDQRGYSYFSPRLHEVDAEPGTDEWARKIVEIDIKAADVSRAMLVIYYGTNSDSGTAFEQGRFFETGRPVVVVHASRDAVANLMNTCGATTNVFLDELGTYDLDSLPVHSFKGELT
jgi:nucleoside 2-deoxyribosyltransferase